MFIVHIALQGCLRARDVEYGKTADTGGHIRYLLELADAAATRGARRQDIVVRRFEDAHLGAIYGQRNETIGPDISIVRIDGETTEYLSKENLHREHGALTASFFAYLRGLDRLPDVIHAHYADAGILAVAAKEAFGIPFVFTAHSLGRVKAETGTDGAADSLVLDRRIAHEERTIAAADRLIASSRDEAELQYGLYEEGRKERIRILPPGCRPRGDTEPDGQNAALPSIRRMLDRPDLPVLLAVARPVRKKNLIGLVEAYGADPDLRTRANLVIVAGSRTDLATERGEHAHVLRDLLLAVDRHDLWGHVALPKRHRPPDVEEIYDFAAERRGIFVNPALSEPFGLTLLEAACAGLPVVATRNGGPNDIVGRLQNGLIVDPLDREELTVAMGRLLTDTTFYDACRERGLAGADIFTWDRFAEDYLAELEAVLQPQPIRPFRSGEKYSHLLVSDIDDTLVGCDDSLTAFGRWRTAAPNYCFAIATGRSLHGAVDILRSKRAPAPRILVTDVGSEIYFAGDDELRNLSRDDEWSAHISEGWSAAEVAECLSGLPFLRPQAPVEQTAHKRSFFAEREEDAVSVREILADRGLAATVIHSHGRFLDVLPERASKGAALRYLADKLDVGGDATLAAGDSGNDLQMLQDAAFGIVVGNHKPELNVLRATKTAYFAKAHYAAGILEGVEAMRAGR